MLSIWKSVLPNLFLKLGAVWIQFGAIWLNFKTLSVKWRSHCLGLTVLTYCGQFLLVSIWQSTLPNQFPNLGAMWINYCFHTIVWRMAAIFLGLNVLTHCLLKQNSFYFADDIFVYIFEFVLLLHMQLSYLKMNLKSWSAKYRPYCLCLDVLTRCGRDRVTSILKTTFSISFLTSGEIGIRYKNLHTWNGSHVSAAMLWGRDKMMPLSRWYIQINFPVWNCFVIFFSNLT